ncbi:MAG: hypothetical protein IMZ55_19315, partial [Acidobacteria bacterium]|nr:hypothetical protein [Acidobacteriota bacterium]
MRILLSALLAVTLAIAVNGCAHPQARTQPDMPPLDVPVVPARVIAPPPPEELPPPATQEQEAPARRPIRPRPLQAPPAKTEPPQPPPGVTSPPPAQAAPGAAGTLQTTPPANQAEVVKNVRDLLARAQRDLGRVNYAGLNTDGKAQYDTAK